MARRAKTYLITRQDQLQVLASPVRQTIVTALASAPGPCSVADLSQLVGRAPDSLYYHLRELARVGLVRHAGRGSTGGRAGRLYTAPARQMRIRYDLASRAFRHNMTKTASSMLRLTTREFERGLRNEHAVPEGRRRSLWVGRIEAHLTGAELAEVNRKLNEIIELMTLKPDPGRGKRHAVTLAVVPLPENARNASAPPVTVGKRRTRGRQRDN